MTTQDITVKAALKANSDANRARVRARVAKERPQLDLGLHVPWDALEEQVAEKVVALLDMPVFDLCVGAWKEYRELKEFADVTKHPPEEHNEMALLQHDVVWNYHPKIEISVDKLWKKTIELNLNTTLHLEGAVLGIQGGRVISVTLGDLTVEAELKWGEVLLLEGKSDKLQFSSPIIPSGGIAIPGAQQATP